MSLKHFLYAIALASPAFLECSPTSLFWTNCTTDVVPTEKMRLGFDYYFSPLDHGHLSTLPPDFYATYGLFSWKDLKAEVGVDYLGGTNDPVYLNTKIGIAEDKLFQNAPAFSIGIFNVGTQPHGKNKTTQNIVDVCVGHCLPGWIGGTLNIGFFSGSKAMGKNQQGAMIGYTRSFCPAVDCKKREYSTWAFSADYATGKNTIGGGGVALTHYFTPDIYLETGPVWFNSRSTNGPWKWALELAVII